MEIRKLFDEKRAVSPVIGVILMVAITVILAAVIGTFVLGLGDQVNNNAPQASFEYDFASDTSVDIVHTGGDTLESDTIQVNIGGNPAWNTSGNFGYIVNSGSSLSNWGSGVSAGDDLSIVTNNGQSGNEVRIVWKNPSGGSTNTISQAQWP